MGEITEVRRQVQSSVLCSAMDDLLVYSCGLLTLLDLSLTSMDAGRCYLSVYRTISIEMSVMGHWDVRGVGRGFLVDIV